MVDENQTAPVRRVVAPRVLSLGLVTALLVGSPASAAEDFPHEGERAMPSVLRVGVPVPASGTVALGASAGYGFIDTALDLNSPGSRLKGSVGASVAVMPFLLLGVDAQGHIDIFSSADDSRRPNVLGVPRLTARLQMPASDAIYWGVQLDSRFVGEKAPDVDFGATSPSIRGLLGARLASSTWLGAELGFHLDNSAHSLPAPATISSADRISVGASSSPGIPWGVGVSHRLDFGLELLGEVRGEALVGGDAPGFLKSPWGLGLGARQPVTENLDAMLSADISLSARSDFDPDVYVPVQPRAGVLITAIYRFGVKPEPAVEKPVAKPKLPEKKLEEPPEQPQIPRVPVQGTVVDEGGRPLPDVTVTLTREGGEPLEERSYADGAFEFKDIPEGAVQLTFHTPGYDEIKISIGQGEERKREVVLYPSLPAGQVRGQVRDLKGNPLPAKIIIAPGDKEIEVGEDGTFELELAPGSYTVRFLHPDLSPQQRFVRVQDRGVVILNIALTP